MSQSSTSVSYWTNMVILFLHWSRIAYILFSYSLVKTLLFFSYTLFFSHLLWFFRLFYIYKIYSHIQGTFPFIKIFVWLRLNEILSIIVNQITFTSHILIFLLFFNIFFSHKNGFLPISLSINNLTNIWKNFLDF